ncbi:MAG: HAD-IA family hydrolase [Fimbriimonadaceae bacterium]|nr:HAD-IA family hydrolase [Fimbriimonadaceae bacterium]
MVETHWDYAVHGMNCARTIGLSPTDDWEAAYRRRFLRSLPEFRWANLGGDPKRVTAFWRAFTADWVEEVGLPTAVTEALLSASDEVLYGPQATEFRVYEDVMPTLEALRERGVRLAVLSNWDQSLERVLEARGLRAFLEVVVASLVIGVEKPSPAIFETLLTALDLPPGAVWHVGDNPLDDVQGARGAGLRGLLIDRDHRDPSDWVLTDLRQLLDRIQ